LPARRAAAGLIQGSCDDGTECPGQARARQVNERRRRRSEKRMSLKIRMSRGGAKKRPYFRIVVADSRMPRDGRFIEKVGSYNPMLAKDSPDRVKLDQERIKHWL